MIKDRIVDYFLENMGDLKEVVDLLNSRDSSLPYLEVYPNDRDFFNNMFDDIFDAVVASQSEDYLPQGELVMFDDFGNLKSISEDGYAQLLKDNIDDIVNSLLVYVGKHGTLDFHPEISDLLEEYLGTL